jgi:hypothetical protein
MAPPSTSLPLTDHAWSRMCRRGIAPSDVQRVLEHGRVVHTRGARFHVIGKREVKCGRRNGLDLRDLDGIQVLCAEDGSVITVYRNRDLRNLQRRPRRRRPGHRR